MPNSNNATPCAVQPGDGKVCSEPARVVLFAANPGEFAGVTYQRGDRVLACLTHGGQIYGALTARGDAPAWLAAYGRHQLPQPKMPYHTSETPREVRPRSPRPGWAKR